MKKWIYFFCGINLVFFVAAIFFSKKEIVPTHFGFSGNADEWGSKWTNLLFGIIPIMIVIFHQYYIHTWNKRNVKLANEIIETKLLSVIIPMFIFLGWIFTYTALYGDGSLGSFMYLIPVVIGLVIVVISNDFGKIVQNRTLGIKVYWTLKDETVWKKTHRLGGYLGVIGGFLMIMTGLLGYIYQNSTIIPYGFILSIILIVVIPIIYSWRLYTRLHPKQKG